MTDAREHDETQNARRDFGARGVWDLGTTRAIAFAWCKREGAYHLTDVRSTTRIPTRGRVRLQWRMNVSQRGTNPTVRVGTLQDSRNPRVRALA